MAYYYCPLTRTVYEVHIEGLIPLQCKKENYTFFDGISENEANKIKEKFNKIARNRKLNKEQFIELYKQVKDEDPERLEKVAEIIYTAFDTNKVKINNINKIILKLFFLLLIRMDLLAFKNL